MKKMKDFECHFECYGGRDSNGDDGLGEVGYEIGFGNRIGHFWNPHSSRLEFQSLGIEL